MVLLPPPVEVPRRGAGGAAALADLVFLPPPVEVPGGRAAGAASTVLVFFLSLTITMASVVTSVVTVITFFLCLALLVTTFFCIVLPILDVLFSVQRCVGYWRFGRISVSPRLADFR
jgi:hypothetical protein